MSSAARLRTLALYRKIIRTARKWTAVLPENTLAERKYILEEAGRLFRQNAKVAEPGEIEQCILEGEARLEMAMHYKNPYPRMSNMPPQSMTLGKGRKESELQRIRTLPAHLRSYSKDS
ncbi:putative LYR motif-containing protein 1 [Hypsibius exemplaris]|uniref:LYR motif-containing protein 1 n=1 Tax=Hypsibius exemplaris TaxID=2072580 RepID=A0A1W0WA81_HYPEX|nr:putative LYR motif-containing protein 1 [Hypsibius exemplaris]